MVPQQIKSLFEFIDYLYSNIDNFGQYTETIERAGFLNMESSELYPYVDFQDKLREEQINTEISDIVNLIDENILQPIYAKARELNVFDPDKAETIWNWNYSEIVNLKEQATGDDLSEILNYTNKYIAFRRSTDYTDYLIAGVRFLDLDKVVINEIHNYFSKEKLNEGGINIIYRWLPQLAETPQPIEKQKPEQNRQQIIFKNSETIEKIHSELKGYFPDKEAELLKALQGEQLSEFLLFPHNQNKLVEVFRRIKYNGFLLNNDTEIKNWICETFQFVKKGFTEPQPFNENSVWDNLNKGKGEPTKKERICVVDWLPYKSPDQLEKERQNKRV